MHEVILNEVKSICDVRVLELRDAKVKYEGGEQKKNLVNGTNSGMKV